MINIIYIIICYDYIDRVFIILTFMCVYFMIPF